MSHSKGGGASQIWQNVTGEPGDIKNCDVTKVKLKNYQIYFLDFRLLLFQPENIGIWNKSRQKIVSKQFLAKTLKFSTIIKL